MNDVIVQYTVSVAKFCLHVCDPWWLKLQCTRFFAANTKQGDKERVVCRFPNPILIWRP
jgi:hypothetical protein